MLMQDVPADNWTIWDYDWTWYISLSIGGFVVANS